MQKTIISEGDFTPRQEAMIQGFPEVVRISPIKDPNSERAQVVKSQTVRGQLQFIRDLLPTIAESGVTAEQANKAYNLGVEAAHNAVPALPLVTREDVVATYRIVRQNVKMSAAFLINAISKNHTEENRSGGTTPGKLELYAIADEEIVRILYTLNSSRDNTELLLGKPMLALLFAAGILSTTNKAYLIKNGYKLMATFLTFCEGLNAISQIELQTTDATDKVGPNNDSPDHPSQQKRARRGTRTQRK